MASAMPKRTTRGPKTKTIKNPTTRMRKFMKN